VGLVADTVDGLESFAPSDHVSGASLLPGLPYLQGVIKQEDGLILIHDLDLFLSLDEERELDKAMTNVPND